MSPNVYLRRAPRSTARRTLVTRWIAGIAVVLLFAVLETAASVRHTGLTRDIQLAKQRIDTLQSERSFLVRQMGRLEGRAVGLAHVDHSFVPPDSGCVRLVAKGTRS